LARLQNKYRLLESKLWKKAKALSVERVKVQKLELLLSQKSSCGCHLLSQEQRVFINTQAMAKCLPKRSMRWTWVQKADAICRYILSPSLYMKIDMKKWHYPHPNTLLKMVRPVFQEVSFLIFQ
jgi:hypothetical protein